MLRGGRIEAVDASIRGATALAVVGERIAEVGSDRDLERWIGPRTRVIELGGRLAIPGLVESHGHLVSLGESLTRLDLADCRTWEDVVARVAGRAATLPPGSWVVGRGWHQEKWDEPPDGAIEGFPTRDLLDLAVPDHPVLLTHGSGHAAIANGRALAAAGIGPGTPDPEGGVIVRRAGGEPTGLLHENAEGLVETARLAGGDAAARRAELAAAAERALAEAARHGVTTFHDAGATFETVEVLDELGAAGKLPIRVRVMLSEPAAALEARGAGYRKIGAHGGMLTVRAVKRWADGALGNRGAWLLAPYSDAPDLTGMPVTPAAELERTARFAAQNGFQLAIHAIGDRANREVLDLFERHLPAAGPDPRWRIEHAQHLDPSDIPRFARLGVIAAMQGIHCTSDGPWVPARLGELRTATGAYAWRALRDSGATIANGTDVPVEAIDPFANFAAMISRRLPDGTAFHPEQALGREEALEAYTLAGAFAGFDDRDTGSLTPGKYADIVVLSRDVLRVPESEIAGTEVLGTIVSGKVVYGTFERGDP